MGPAMSPAAEIITLLHVSRVSGSAILSQRCDVLTFEALCIEVPMFVFKETGAVAMVGGLSELASDPE